MHTRRLALLTLALAIATVLQSTQVNRVPMVIPRPDLVLLLVVTHSVLRGVEEGLLGGILGGLMVDLLSVVPFGAGTLGMGLTGLATGLGETNLYRANFLIPLVAVFLTTVFYHSFLMLALQAAGWSVDWISTLALQTIPGAALNSLLAPLAFPLVRRLIAPEAGKEPFRW